MSEGGVSGGGSLIPHRRSARVSGVFAWYTRWLFGRRFNAVRFERSSLASFERFWASGGPAIVLGNHQGWWDPLVAVLMNDRLNARARREGAPGRGMLALMDSAELERFAIFRRLGVFGVDPDDPSSLDAMVGYLERVFAADGRQAFWITPQGSFTDVRVPMRLRPGAAAVASRLGGADGSGVRVGGVHMDYVFWNEAKPELLIRFEEVERPARASTAGWLRSMTAAMERNREASTALAVARDAGPFETVVGSGGSGGSGVYGLWLRATGRAGELGSARGDRAGGVA